MKILKTVILIIGFVLLVWFNMPENVPVNFTVAGKEVSFTINPPSLNFQMGSNHIQRDFRTQFGLDLRGGSRLVFQADTSELKDADVEEALESSRNIIEQRVNYFGISEPSIRTIKSQGKYLISVELPGVQDVQSAVSLIGSTAQLSFREEEESTEEAELATDSAQFLFENLTKETGLTGEHVEKATVQFDPQSGEPTVVLTFTPEGGQMFKEITERNIGKPVGIFLDNIPVSVPTVQQAIADGTAVISGGFTVDMAKSLAIAINSGALPVPVQLVEQQNVGPSLGEIELRASLFAGIVGIVMVMFFMIMVYGRLGIIACVALTLYALISHAIFRFIPVVLTLPGLAGFILSIGMAVDANVLIFERIKEEVRKGREFRAAIRVGFSRAFEAIKDANVTTLLVMFVLFNPLNWEFLPQYGLVRGFALTLSIGVLTSLFTGVFVTKRLIQMFYKKK